MPELPFVEINKFLGLNTGKDKLSLLPGQLSVNKNYRYMATGGLQERGGGAMLSNPPASGRIYGAENYRNNSGSEYLVITQGTDCYYYNSGWQALSLTLTSNQEMVFAEAGHSTSRALYGVNENDAPIKIYMSGSTVTATQLTTGNGFTNNAPTDGRAIIMHKNRGWILSKNTLTYSNTLDFDEYPTTNSFKVAPGIDGECRGMAVWGDALFIFKDYGVYVLPNADEATTSWVLLKANALTGTQSPKTIQRTKIGIIYLASDNVVRLIAPDITFSSGEFTLGGSQSPIISHAIESSLSSELDVSNKDKACATIKEDEYILSFQSNSNSNSYNDKTYFADTNKFLQIEGITQPQPFWGEYTNFNFNYYAKQYVSGRVKLYGFKGNNGECHETLNDTIHNDNSGAIESFASLGWIPINGAGWLKRFSHIYVSGDTENWNLTLRFKSYLFSRLLPGDGEGTVKTYTTILGTNSIVGTATIGTAVIGQTGQGTSKYRTNLKGNYFSAEFENKNANEFTRINNLIIYFTPIRRD